MRHQVNTQQRFFIYLFIYFNYTNFSKISLISIFLLILDINFAYYIDYYRNGLILYNKLVRLFMWIFLKISFHDFWPLFILIHHFITQQLDHSNFKNKSNKQKQHNNFYFCCNSFFNSMRIVGIVSSLSRNDTISNIHWPLYYD